ncbi:MAG: transcriptional regulator [Pirellulales bacterium]|nr:transcriptional regulator [Pirellulales bacterium]
MNPTSRFDQLPADELPADVIALCKGIDLLPSQHRGQLGPAIERVIESTKRRRRILNLVQDALSQLRLDMKYLMFDLEATRRERDEFRKQLDGI